MAGVKILPRFEFFRWSALNTKGRTIRCGAVDITWLGFVLSIAIERA